MLLSVSPTTTPAVDMEEARAYADTIAGNPPLGVRMTKFLIQRGVDSDLQLRAHKDTKLRGFA